MTWAEGKRKKPVGRDRATGPASGTIRLATYDNRPELPEVAQVVEQQLEKAGFRVELTVREYSRLESDALDGEFDAFVLARNTLVDTGDPVAVLASDYTCDGGYNIAQLCDENVDRAVAAAERTADDEKRQDAALAAEARILGTDAVVPSSTSGSSPVSPTPCRACSSTRTSAPSSARERGADPCGGRSAPSCGGSCWRPGWCAGSGCCPGSPAPTPR